jgi:hypothetical protein
MFVFFHRCMLQLAALSLLPFLPAPTTTKHHHLNFSPCSSPAHVFAVLIRSSLLSSHLIYHLLSCLLSPYLSSVLSLTFFVSALPTPQVFIVIQSLLAHHRVDDLVHTMGPGRARQHLKIIHEYGQKLLSI